MHLDNHSSNVQVWVRMVVAKNSPSGAEKAFLRYSSLVYLRTSLPLFTFRRRDPAAVPVKLGHLTSPP